MFKHVCDAGNGILWLDDSQITAKYGGIELDRHRPRTILVHEGAYRAVISLRPSSADHTSAGHPCPARLTGGEAVTAVTQKQRQETPYTRLVIAVTIPKRRELHDPQVPCSPPIRHPLTPCVIKLGERDLSRLSAL